jgi:hypothetical protein
MSTYIFLICFAVLVVFLIVFTKLNKNKSIISYETKIKIGNKFFYFLKVNQDPNKTEEAIKHKRPPKLNDSSNVSS